MHSNVYVLAGNAFNILDKLCVCLCAGQFHCYFWLSRWFSCCALNRFFSFKTQSVLLLLLLSSDSFTHTHTHTYLNAFLTNIFSYIHSTHFLSPWTDLLLCIDINSWKYPLIGIFRYSGTSRNKKQIAAKILFLNS